MKKIPSLFKRDYEGTRLIYDEAVEGSEWVLAGEGVAYVKFDGTSCLVDQDGVLFKRYDRKRNKKTGQPKPAPDGWVPCEDTPNQHTGHWPGWLPVGDGPEDRRHREARDNTGIKPPPGTYELVGPKVQGNPYELKRHVLWSHTQVEVTDAPRRLEALRRFFESFRQEGLVWHHPDGRMVKIKRRDFGLDWPISRDERQRKQTEET